jgi:hypothetical protein
MFVIPSPIELYEYDDRFSNASTAIRGRDASGGVSGSLSGVVTVVVSESPEGDEIVVVSDSPSWAKELMLISSSAKTAVRINIEVLYDFIIFLLENMSRVSALYSKLIFNGCTLKVSRRKDRIFQGSAQDIIAITQNGYAATDWKSVDQPAGCRCSVQRDYSIKCRCSVD